MPPARGVGQHRCHARLADVSHCFLSLRLDAAPGRIALWARCLASAAGSEPSEPYLLDPAAQALRFRDCETRSSSSSSSSSS